MAEKIIDVQVFPPPQSVVDAIASLSQACGNWPTKKVTIDTNAPPTLNPEASSTSEAMACGVVTGGPEYVNNAIETTAWMGVAAGVIAAILFWVALRFARSVWSMVSTVWRNYQYERIT